MGETVPVLTLSLYMTDVVSVDCQAAGRGAAELEPMHMVAAASVALRFFPLCLTPRLV